MFSTALVIVVICWVLILHTYVFYPIGIILLAKTKTNYSHLDPDENTLPNVAVLIAAYNEEQVIVKKLTSIVQSNYPSEKLTVLVGSDASDDKTDELVEQFAAIYKSVKLYRFESRTGKITIINQLQSKTDAEILVLTDANVILEPNCIKTLVAGFAHEGVGLIAANISKKSKKEIGITRQEKFYLNFENKIKQAESTIWQLIVGAEGGCYAIKNQLYKKVPANFIVDDFYITMQLLRRGSKALFEPKARCFEDVHPDEKGEFRRKVRISAGNFQNLLFFKRILLKPFSKLGFAFISHKVLRWATPFLLLISIFFSLPLAFQSTFYKWMLLLQFTGFLSPFLSKLVGDKITLLKFVSHFYLMNAALLTGFVRFSRGIRSSVWQPVKRDV